MPSATKAAQVRLNRVTPSHCRVVLDNPPLNLMGPEFVLQIREIVTALENDDRVKVVVFESAVDGFFLNHSDFLAKFEDLTSIPQGPTGLEAWPDVLVRLTRAPFVSIALIRGRATGNGSELALACDMSLASREKARRSSKWALASSLAGEPMAPIARSWDGDAPSRRSSETTSEALMPSPWAMLNVRHRTPSWTIFCRRTATWIARSHKLVIANTKRLCQRSQPARPTIEIRAGWNAWLPSSSDQRRGKDQSPAGARASRSRRLGRSTGSSTWNSRARASAEVRTA